MNVINNAINNYSAEFRKFLQSLNGSQDPAIQNIRNDAFFSVQENGFPTVKDESWRFTDLTPLFNQPFNLSASKGIIKKSDIQKYILSDVHALQLVFIDGKFYKEFSRMINPGQSIEVKNLAEVMRREPQKVKTRLMRQEDSFSALNTAFVNDGSYIAIPENREIRETIHLIFLSAAHKNPTVSYIRNIIDLGRNAQVRIVESYYSLYNQTAYCNTLTDIRLGENSKLEHIKLQNENLNGFHLGRLFIDQQRDSRFHSFSLNFGGAWVRNNLFAKLSAPNCKNLLYGLYMGHKRQHIDNNTVIEHAAPRCESRELYQGILSDQAHGVFSGMIYVHPGAAKTDARQNNNCLLLSPKARIDSKPQLEIYADDVKCTHGATVGRLDEQQIFYLRSRGLGRQQAKNILTYAYAEKVVEKINILQVRDLIDEILLERLQEDTNFRK